jgi:hypothetical protein
MLKSGPFPVFILPITQFEWIENKIEQVLHILWLVSRDYSPVQNPKDVN